MTTPTNAPESAGGETRADLPLRMDAYYFGFRETGQRPVDLILSAIAYAGKGYHHTEYWSEENQQDWPPFKGQSYVEWIQNAADDAAAKIAALEAENAAMRLSTPAAPQPETCSQCGKPWADEACGPTHALIAHEQAAPQPETECPNADVSNEPWIAHTTCSLCAPSRSLDDLLTDMAMWPWQPGRWFRVVTPAGELWAETSDPEEAQRIADKTGWRLERQWFCQPAEWRVVREAAADCHRDPLDDFEEPTPCSRCGTVVELQEMMCCYDCRMKSGICEDCMDEHNADEHAGQR